MRILLTNDDGIHAPGLAVIETIAGQLSDDVWVCAPAQENSGVAVLAWTMPPAFMIRSFIGEVCLPT